MTNGWKLRVFGRLGISPPVEDYQATVGNLWVADSIGTGGVGYGGSPPDPAADIVNRKLTNAKQRPAVNFMGIDDQVLTETSYWCPIQIVLADARPGSPALGRRVNCRLKWYCEGNTGYVLTETTRFWTDKLNRAQSMRAYWVQIMRPSVHLGPIANSPAASMDLYFEGQPIGDPSNFDSRVIGPYKFYPRDASGVVVKTLHKVAGAGVDYTNLLAFFNDVTTVYTASGRAVICSVIDHNEDWAVGKRGSSNAVPWLSRVTPGLDKDTSAPVKYTLGDFASYPADGFSSPRLNKLWFEGFYHDIAKTGGIVTNTTANKLVISDHDTYCTSYPTGPVTALGITYPVYGQGSGAGATIRGRQPLTYPYVPVAGGILTSWCGNWHDLPGCAMIQFTVDVNNDINNVSGSVVQDNFGGRYGGTVQRFGGFYSYLSTRSGDPNGGLGLQYTGGAAWAGVSASPGSTGAQREFYLHEGADSSAPITHTYLLTYDKFMPALAAEINADAPTFTVTNEVTDPAFNLDSTFLHVLGAPTGDVMPKTRIPPGGTLHLDLNYDIHAAGYAMNVAANVARMNTSMVGTRFYNYCAAATIAMSTAANNPTNFINYWDHYIMGCSWRDDNGYTDRQATPIEVGVEAGYWTGTSDGAAITYCTMSSPTANGAAGVGMGQGTFKLKRQSLISYSYMQIPDIAPGVSVTGCVSPYQYIDPLATNSRKLGTVGSTFSDALVFNSATTGDVTLLNPANALLPDSVNYAGVFNALGNRQDTL